MDGLLDRLLTPLASHWHRPVFLLGSIFALTVGFVGLLPDWSDYPYRNFALVLTTDAVAVLLWFYVRRVPSAKPGTIGIALAITSEQSAHRKQIIKDLLPAFSDTFDTFTGSKKFEVLVVPEWLANTIDDNDSAKKVAMRVNAALLVFGDAKIRLHHGKEHHVLSMKQMAQHRPVDQRISDVLGQEVSSVFPGVHRIPRDTELEGIDITSSLTAITAKYFVAVAGLLSGLLDFSESLLQSLRVSPALDGLSKEKLSQGGRVRSCASTLKRLIDQRLATIASHRGYAALREWQDTHDEAAIDRLRDAARVHHQLSGDPYPYSVQHAMWLFVRKRDVNGAMADLSRVRGKDDSAWRYSLAFLHAYRGELDRALRYYRQIFRRHDASSQFFDVEHFIAWVIAEEPEKCWLYFCLGIVNAEGKGDEAQALKDYRRFLDCSFPDGFDRNSGAAIRYAERFIDARI